LCGDASSRLSRRSIREGKDEGKVRIYIQHGDSLPRVAYTFENRAAWDAAKTRNGKYVEVALLADVLVLGEAYMPPSPVTSETWPVLASLLFGAARDMVMRAPQVFELQLFPKCGSRLHRPVREEDFKELSLRVKDIMSQQERMMSEGRRRAAIRRRAIEKLTEEERGILELRQD
jgi:hypothetical protein